MLKFLIILHTLMKYKSQVNITLDLKSKAKKAKALFIEHNVKQIPILDNGIYKGLLFYKDVKNVEDDYDLKELESVFEMIFLTSNYTIFDWFRLSSLNKIDIIPIIDQPEYTYIKSLNFEDFIEKFKNTGLNVELSSILILKKPTPDFKYSEVFQIAEAHGSKIFASYISSSDSVDTEIILNIHHLSLNELLQTYRRYGFDIISYHDEDLHHETLQANSDYFSKYITV